MTPLACAPAYSAGVGFWAGCLGASGERFSPDFMETAMRHPFFMDHLDPNERKVIGRMHAGVVCGYLFLLLALMFAVKVHSPNVEVVAMDSDSVGDEPRKNLLADAFSAAAAERPGLTACASRDLKLVISLADHGEAQDVPVEALNSAFLALVKARSACAAGRVDEAVAIYDGIAIVPRQSARK
jgi:hypothetical protein